MNFYVFYGSIKTVISIQSRFIGITQRSVPHFLNSSIPQKFTKFAQQTITCTMPSFFKLRKNKKFEYTPRYYDERKERLENMKKQHGNEKTTAEQRMRGKFKRPTRTTMPGIFSGATLRTFIILGILVMAVYYLLKKYQYI